MSLPGAVSRATLALAVMLALGVARAEPAWAQRRDTQESRLLREASARESRGDLEGAEGVLRRLLRARPGSSGALFALERVLRAQGETDAILPAVDSFLAHDPTSVGVRYLKLRVLVEVDSVTELEREASRWFALDRTSTVPYREVARVYERAFGADRALEVLRSGREATGREAALALEIGDLLAATGVIEEAVSEWASAVGDDGGQAPVIARRIAGLAAPLRDDAASQLVAALGDSDLVARRRAGARIALDLGMGEAALELARDVVAELEGRDRSSFLSDLARRAQEGDQVEVATWAYQELGQDVTDTVDRRRLDERIVDVALASGDTAAALEAQQRVADSYAAGSVDRRRAAAQVIRLEGTGSDPERLRELLAAYRAEFPQAPELDDLAATVAAGILARGDPAGAADVLAGIEGPRSAIERAYLLLDAGQIDAGRQALLTSLPGLAATEATEVIQLAGLLERLSAEGGALLASASVTSHRSSGEAAASEIAAGAEALEVAERPTLLAQAARIADGGGASGAAADLRARILREYPEAPEVEEASLQLARHRARTPDGVASAIRILEELITARPNAAVAPDARQELERLRGRGS